MPGGGADFKPVITEVRLVRTAYGFAKLAEIGKQGALRMPQLSGGVRLVPYTETRMIMGVYEVDVAGAQDKGEGVFEYPILETVPYFLLDDLRRDEMFAQVKTAGGELRTPEEQDLTASVRSALEQAQLVASARPDTMFKLEQFVANISKVRTSDQFKNIYLINTTSNQRWVMAVDQIIENVIDMHPYFVQLHQPDSVCISFEASKNTWLAPFGALAA